MRCEAVELELSARLDGEGDRRLDDAVSSHLATCSSCRAFETGAQGLRVATRVRPAAPVPDLVPRIMAAIEAPARLHRTAIWQPRQLLPYAASFVTGAVVASLLLGGLPGIRRGPSPALATEIPREIAAASTQVTSYRATFEIEERNFSADVERRRFTADIRFVAPERFRAAVTDLTTYPGEGWTHNDFVLSVDENEWRLDAPRTCPREAQPGCVALGRDTRSVVGRAPFESDTAMPTDIVLPVRTLVDADSVNVVDETTLLGRDAVTLELAYNEATPLFSYLHSAGTWRPFFPQDHVLVTLDSESWFPLGYEVRAGSSVERSEWATRQGLPDESPGDLLFRAEASQLGAGPGPEWHPIRTHDPAARNHGFVDEPPSSIRSFLGDEPPLPTHLAGLRPYGSGLIGNRFVFAYSRGLGWLTVTGSHGDLIPSDPLGMPVDVGEGVGQYSPATSEHGRRLALRDGQWDVVLETNLPRADLLAAATSVPMIGFLHPGDPQTIEDAQRAVPLLLTPAPVPDGYRLWIVDAQPGSATLHYLRPASELDGVGIRIFQSSEAELPPPLDLEVLGVSVRGLPGRYSAERGELEWVEGGVYRSLQAPAFDLAGLLRIAETLT